MSFRLRRFLIVSGWVLLGVGTIRFYRLIRTHVENEYFAPHLLVTSLSIWIATSILRIGLKKKEPNKRSAISLIRSGSILLMIWSYRLVLYLRNPGEVALPLQAYLAPFYIVFGTVIMCVGLKISRGLRKNTAQMASIPTKPLTTTIEDSVKK
ncbi:hypothetical protein JYT87_02645 [Nitrospira defluvii]|nr:hypothetical protein [Nitrospira defluvii]